MPNLAIIPTFVRELFVSRSLPREPEPDLIMDGPEQVAAYAKAGRVDGGMASVYLFHSARASKVLQGCRTVYDLGCGPATQLAQIAELNPDIQFIGIDLSSTMLVEAEKHVRNLGLNNVSFRQGDITNLNTIADGSADGVISTVALHHLPTAQLLQNCFHEIKRILKPGAALYLTDFGRLKSLKSVIFLAYTEANHQPHIFSLDYERSMRAAFLLEDFQKLASDHFANQAYVVSTFKVPFLLIVKTKDRPLPESLMLRLQSMRRALPKKFRRDLDDLRFFFKLGGLMDDPFKSRKVSK